MSTKLTRSTLGVEDVLMRSDTPEQGGANEKSYMFAISQCVFIHLVSDIWSVDLKFVLSAGDSLSVCVLRYRCADKHNLKHKVQGLYCQIQNLETGGDWHLSVYPQGFKELQLRLQRI